MYVVTYEQQQKFISRINDNISLYTNLIKEVNKSLLSYGREYFDYIKGKITSEYILEKRSNLLTGIHVAEKSTFTAMVSDLNQLKEDYIKECFPESVTTDPIELDFIGKELEVMSRDELEMFYQDNFRDSNKMRLFAIEIKRRSRSDNSELKTDAATLKILQDGHSIQDRVIKAIDERIKYVNGLMQLSSGGLFLVKIDEEDQIQTRLVSYKDVVALVNGRSTMAMPQDMIYLTYWNGGKKYDR